MIRAPDAVVNICTLGRFTIVVNGFPVTPVWPSETVKVLFCSLLSPLDVIVSWDRLCRALWGVPEERISRQRVNDIIILPLRTMLRGLFGHDPLVTYADGIRLDHTGIYVDALEFFELVINGVSCEGNGDHAGACNKFFRAEVLYVGVFMPGIAGKIIESTRKELEVLFHTTVSGVAYRLCH